MLLNDTPLEFHNNAGIQLDTGLGHSFKIKSGNYYWRDTNTNKNNLSILNGTEKELLFMNEDNVVFYNRLKDRTGKKYVLEDEVNAGSRLNTSNYFNDEFLYINNTKTYKTTNNTICNDETQNNYIDNSITYKTINNSFIDATNNSLFEKKTTTTNFNLDEQAYYTLKKKNYNDFNIDDSTQYNIKKQYNNQYYNYDELYIDNSTVQNTFKLDQRMTFDETNIYQNLTTNKYLQIMNNNESIFTSNINNLTQNVQIQDINNFNTTNNKYSTNLSFEDSLNIYNKSIKNETNNYLENIQYNYLNNKTYNTAYFNDEILNYNIKDINITNYYETNDTIYSSTTYIKKDNYNNFDSIDYTFNNTKKETTNNIIVNDETFINNKTNKQYSYTDVNNLSINNKKQYDSLFLEDHFYIDDRVIIKNDNTSSYIDNTKLSILNTYPSYHQLTNNNNETNTLNKLISNNFLDNSQNNYTEKKIKHMY